MITQCDDLRFCVWKWQNQTNTCWSDSGRLFHAAEQHVKKMQEIKQFLSTRSSSLVQG